MIKSIKIKKTITQVMLTGLILFIFGCTRESENGQTPLMEAARKGKVEIVKSLIEEGAEINAKDEDGWTALMLAAVKGHPEAVTALINAGAEVYKKSKRQLLIPRYGLSAVCANNYIYVLGGSSLRGITGVVERYNINDERSKLLNINLLPRRYHTAELYNGKIYIMGGYNSKNELVDSVEIVDIETGKVSYGTPLPRPRYFGDSVLIKDKIYFVGGSTFDKKSVTTVDIYNIKKDRWEKGTSMPESIQTDLVYKFGKIYAIGGFNGVKAVKDFFVFNINDNSWEKLDELPFPLSAHNAVAVDNKIYSFGDYYELDRIWEYNFGEKVWDVIMSRGIHTKTELPSGVASYKFKSEQIYSPSRHNAVVVKNDKIYIIGGNRSSYGSYIGDIQVIGIQKLEEASRQ